MRKKQGAVQLFFTYFVYKIIVIWEYRFTNPRNKTEISKVRNYFYDDFVEIFLPRKKFPNTKHPDDVNRSIFTTPHICLLKQNNLRLPLYDGISVEKLVVQSSYLTVSSSNFRR